MAENSEVLNELKHIFSDYGLRFIELGYITPAFHPIIAIETIVEYRLGDGSHMKVPFLIGWNVKDDGDFRLELMEEVREYLDKEYGCQ